MVVPAGMRYFWGKSLELLSHQEPILIDLLARFKPYNLQAVFCGHWHGFTKHQVGAAVLTTNRCCALKRNNHDNMKEKGYFLCTAAQGKITRDFIEVKE